MCTHMEAHTQPLEELKAAETQKNIGLGIFVFIDGKLLNIMIS